MVFKTNFEVSKTIGLYFTPKSWKLQTASVHEFLICSGV